MEGLMMDETMSNLTSASGGEVSGSSGSRIEAPGSIFQYQQSFTSPANQPPPPPPTSSQKRKRSQPGHPDPDAEVIALSPKSLMAANRFMCEICGKGFQRDQNLQLHRRSHNLPWKLKQRPNKEAVRRRVYVCPEVTCVHHDSSRALGDLTGIKKHFSRKHGEKKWKCDKCSKRYAVQSDWKAHSKICGTREYKCDCGTIFSRRDSFITHRAFCDALAEDSARSATTGVVNPLFSSSNQHQLINLPPNLIKREQETNNLHHILNLRFPSLDHNTPWLGGGGGGDSSGTTFDPFFHPQNTNPSRSPHQVMFPPFHPPQGSSSSPHMSATALLQKAAQMGVTMSKPSSDPSLPSPASVSSAAAANNNNNIIIPGERKGGVGMVHLPHHQAHMFSEHNAIIGNPSRDHGTAFYDHEEVRRILNPKRPSSSGVFNESGGVGNANEGMTRDFLGLKAFSHGDFFHIPGIDDDQLGDPSGNYGKQKTDINTTFWQG